MAAVHDGALPPNGDVKAKVTAKKKVADDKPIMTFRAKNDWSAWLEREGSASAGVWIRLATKASGIESIAYDEAVEAALCHGWIDGQGRSDDENWWLQKFTPRGKRSIWSKRNREKVAALTKSGEMKPAGLAEVDRAKADGRWDAAYDSPKQMSVPDDFESALTGNARAKKFFLELDSQNRYAILFRVNTATKPETRAKRIEKFVSMLALHEKIYP